MSQEHTRTQAEEATKKEIKRWDILPDTADKVFFHFDLSQELRKTETLRACF